MYVKVASFMGHFFQELTVAYNTGAAESFHLLGLVVKQLFVDLAVIRGHAKYMAVGKTQGGGIWVTLQAHRLMQDYLTAGFRGHPLVELVITLHLYKHRVLSTTHTALAKMVTGQVAEVKKLNSCLDKCLDKTSHKT